MGQRCLHRFQFLIWEVHQALVASLDLHLKLLDKHIEQTLSPKEKMQTPLQESLLTFPVTKKPIAKVG